MSEEIDKWFYAWFIEYFLNYSAVTSSTLLKSLVNQKYLNFKVFFPKQLMNCHIHSITNDFFLSCTQLFFVWTKRRANSARLVQWTSRTHPLWTYDDDFQWCLTTKHVDPYSSKIKNEMSRREAKKILFFALFCNWKKK